MTTKVLYIGGTGRSGSTILDRLLGAVPGWFSGGELAFVWRFGLEAGGRCSCGETLADCDVWGKALGDAGLTGADAQRMIALRKRFWSVHLPLMVNQRLNNRLLDRLEDFPAVSERLYRSLASSTGARVIVDSSKEPHYSYILRERTDLDIYFLHLVRDPRAIGYSWQRQKVEKGLTSGELMERRPSPVASIYFDVSNAAAERLWRNHPDRYRFLRYEDFVANPAATLEAVAEFVGEPVSADQILDGSTFQPRPSHSAWGNPNRFSNDRVTLRADTAWQSELGGPDGAVLTAMCAPLAKRYGYRWRRADAPKPTVPAARLRRQQLVTTTEDQQ